MALRSFVLLLAAYVIFHKIFPFDRLGNHLADLTVGEFLIIVFRTLAATTVLVYLLVQVLRQPALQMRDRIWCERWCGLAFGVIAIVAGSISVAFLERNGMPIGAVHWVARGILWLLF